MNEKTIHKGCGDTTAERSRGRGRPKTRDRASAVEAAMLAYWEAGPDELTIAAASAQMGISKPGLYREFGGEDGLLAAALERYEAVRITPLLKTLEVDRPFAEALGALASWLGSEREGLPEGCLLARARRATRRPGPETAAQIAEMTRNVQAAYTAFVERAEARGETARNLDSELAGQYLDTLLTTFLNLRATGVGGELVARQARLAFASLSREPDTLIG